MTEFATMTPPEQPYLATLTGVDLNDAEAFKAVSLPFFEQLLPPPSRDQWSVMRYADQPPSAPLPFNADELAAIAETQLALNYLGETARTQTFSVAQHMIVATQLFPRSARGLEDRRQSLSAIFSAVRPAIRYAAADCQPTAEEEACLKLFRDLPDRLLALNGLKALPQN